MKFQTSSLRQNSFQDMNLSPVLFTALEKMSIKKPTPIQSQAIPVVMNGSDLIGIAQTGSGKTLAYALSVLTGLANKPNSRALILAPSREMAQQIYKVFLDLCKEMPVSVCLAIGGTTGSKQANQLKKNPKIIIATPGRMNDHLQTNKLLLKDVEYVVIDEADRMLDMGFAPQLKNIQATLRGNRQTLMFSASFGHNVDMIAQLFLHPKAVMIRSEQAEAPVESLKQKVLFLDRTMKNDRLLDELNATRGGVIVFTGSQESCENVGEYLKSYGFDTDLIHGGLSQGQRNRVVRAFREGEIRIMVATDLLARGLDVPHVDHVVNFDLPFQAEDFLHRIGRTARAGRNGEAITFVTPSDHRMYNKVKVYLQGAKEEKLDPSFKFIDRSKKFAKNSDTKPASKKSAGKGAPPSKKGSGKSSVNPFKKRR
ncbi:DEAD/DEAH box helicase [Bdellovibrio sp. HCB185ZH]|uniref:DEAD/DEAH box helicase n=1 Tax=Bdellovibrio sp. HCB185ZH TaxID=3394235 RepID=UPI0039A53F33